MTILMVAGLAWALPDRLASTYVSGTEVTDVVVSEEGQWIGWPEAGAGSFTILDPGFTSTIQTTCAGARGAAVFGDSTTGWTFLSGCADGTVMAVEVSAEGEFSLGATTWSVGEGAVYAVESDGTNVYALVDEAEGMVVSAVTLADGAKVDGYPVSMTSDTVEDTLLMAGSLFVVHGADEISEITASSGTLVTAQSNLGRTLVDAFPYATSSAVYLADSGGGLVKYDSANDYLAILTNVADSVTAVGIHPDEGWAVLGAGDDALLYTFDGGTFEAMDTIVGAANIDEFVVIDGYAFGATADGTVLVLTDRPWVTVAGVSPASVVDGDVVSVEFSTDTAGSYEVWVGGTYDDPGTRVDSGDIDALATVTSEFTVADLDEGTNPVWVYVDAGSDAIGRGSGSLTVDNPPEKVKLTAAGVGFGNAAVYVEFDALDASDIATYVIYFTDEPFTADEHATGGPGYTGEDDISVPILATAEPGDRVSRTISPLTNGTTYYVAVRAIDDSNMEGPMSAVRTATPEETLCAACLAGDEGGYWPALCGTGTARGAGVLGLLFASVAVVRRRSRGIGLTAALTGLAVFSPTANAAEAEESPVAMNLQLRYGPTTVADSYVQKVFGNSPNEMLWFEYGYASRFVDVTLGLGFYQELGWLQTAAGAPSAEHDMFTMFPITLTVSGRLDFLKEQPIVPVARVGLDYWLWKENWQVPDPDSMDYVRDGGKYGWHYGGAVMILLDTIDRRAASRLDASTGINDTYLVAEYRRTNLVTGAKMLDLSSSEFTFGLKFDF